MIGSRQVRGFLEALGHFDVERGVELGSPPDPPPIVLPEGAEEDPVRLLFPGGEEYALDRMQVVSVRPDDYLVLRTHLVLGPEAMGRVQRMAAGTFGVEPGHVVVLEQGMELGVVRSEKGNE